MSVQEEEKLNKTLEAPLRRKKSCKRSIESVVYSKKKDKQAESQHGHLCH